MQEYNCFRSGRGARQDYGTGNCVSSDLLDDLFGGAGNNAMQCNAMQCNAMHCNAMQCNAMQCNATQCNAMQLCYVNLGADVVHIIK